MFSDLSDDCEPQFVSPIPMGKMIEWLEKQGYEVITPEDLNSERGRASAVKCERDILRKHLDMAAGLYTKGHDSRDILAALMLVVEKVPRM